MVYYSHKEAPYITPGDEMILLKLVYADRRWSALDAALAPLTPLAPLGLLPCCMATQENMPEAMLARGEWLAGTDRELLAARQLRRHVGSALLP